MNREETGTEQQTQQHHLRHATTSNPTGTKPGKTHSPPCFSPFPFLLSRLLIYPFVFLVFVVYMTYSKSHKASNWRFEKKKKPKIISARERVPILKKLDYCLSNEIVPKVAAQILGRFVNARDCCCLAKFIPDAKVPINNALPPFFGLRELLFQWRLSSDLFDFPVQRRVVHRSLGFCVELSTCKSARRQWGKKEERE